MNRLPARARRTLAWALGLALLGTGALELWTRLPVGSATPALDLPAGATTVVLVIHGSADADNPLLAEIVAGLRERFGSGPGTAVRYVRWAPESDQRLRAAATARAVGARLGAELARLEELRQVHFVAHSVGAFMPDAICQVLRAPGKPPPRMVMTLLDPFQIRGFLDWRYGARQHGRCADFALAVMNTDDPAPATTQFLARAYNLDVTAHPDRAGFPRNGHYWPLQFYRDQLLPGEPGLAGWSHGDRPRGQVVPVPGTGDDATVTGGFPDLNGERGPR